MSTNKNTQRGDGVRVVDSVGDYGVTFHAVKRWHERTDVPCTLAEAWDVGVHVFAPEVGGSTRLYCPEDALIVQRGGLIRTVLRCQYRRLLTGHLRTCADCGGLWDPAWNDGCHWCTDEHAVEAVVERE